MNRYKKLVGLATLMIMATTSFAASTNANLDAIEISNKGVNVVTGFSTSTVTYDFTPSPAPTQVTLRAVPSDKKATVAIKVGANSYSNHSFVTLPIGTVAIIFSVTAEDGTTKKDYTVTLTYTVDPAGKSLETNYYSTNPNGGVGKYSTSMAVSCTNMRSEGFTDWSADMLIAQGAANDVCQSFYGSHEGPSFDTYGLYAAWDNSNLYIGIQYVNVVDVVDSQQGYPQSGNGKPYGGKQPICVALDIDASKSTDGTLADGKTGVWEASGKATRRFTNGLDVLLMAGSNPSDGVPAMYKINPQGNLDTTSTGPYRTVFNKAGIVYGYVDGLLPCITKIYGINKSQTQYTGYVASMLELNTGFVDLLTASPTHSKLQDTFLEFKIPFAALGIDKAYLEANGVGAMVISTFGTSGTGSIPYDNTVYDVVSVECVGAGGTSAEKIDNDIFTYKMARIGKK